MPATSGFGVEKNSFLRPEACGELLYCLRLLAGVASFLCLPKERTKERAATPLRRPRSISFDPGEAKTRCAQTVSLLLRDQSSPNGSAPTAPVVPEWGEEVFGYIETGCIFPVLLSLPLSSNLRP